VYLVLKESAPPYGCDSRRFFQYKLISRDQFTGIAEEPAGDRGGLFVQRLAVKPGRRKQHHRGY
jgi:hypothetical protein